MRLFHLAHFPSGAAIATVGSVHTHESGASSYVGAGPVLITGVGAMSQWGKLNPLPVALASCLGASSGTSYSTSEPNWLPVDVSGKAAHTLYPRGRPAGGSRLLASEGPFGKRTRGWRISLCLSFPIWKICLSDKNHLF